MFILRDYQEKAKSDVYHSWSCGFRNVLLRLPTGGGKSVILTSIAVDTLYTHKTAIMVHRKELVQQLCLTLAKQGVEHNIIASKKDIRGIIAAERRVCNRSYYYVNSNVTVISVDTLISRHERYKSWCQSITQVITDEAAHVLKDNKWGKAQSYFPNARSLGVTATPERLDRKGLGSHVDGIYDTMVEGPDTAWMINNGFLSRYKIAIPESDYRNYLESKSEKSDYSKKAMMQASQQSQITGDVVENYLKFAKGKQAIVFATDVTTAKQMEKKFKEAGVEAKELNGTTNDSERLEGILNFEAKKIKVLINVDLFDEGLDVPGIECVIMARPTKSLGKFLQMAGRGLRIMEGKEYMILIDHVGNVMEHGLPCARRTWTLDRIKKVGKKLNLLRICHNVMCNSPYDRSLTECPWCGVEAIKAKRGESVGRIPPQQVDGDLTLVDPETLRELEKLAQLESPADVAQRVGTAINGAAGIKAMRDQQARIETQSRLVEAIAKWAGEKKHYYGYTDRRINKQFWLDHGMTITEALGQKKKDMEVTLQNLGEW